MKKYELLSIPSELDMQRFNYDALSRLYRDGSTRKAVVLKEFESRKNHRSLQIMIFGNFDKGSAYNPHRMNGSTSLMSFNEFYHEWRLKVISALESRSVPGYLHLLFLSTGESLIGERHESRNNAEQLQIIEATFDDTLANLLNIITKLPIIPNVSSVTDNIVSEYSKFQLYESGTIGKNNVKLTLAPQQVKIMSSLINARGGQISRTEVANILWNDDDNTVAYLENDKHSTTDINKRVSTIISKLNTSLRDATDKTEYVLKNKQSTAYYLSS